jgi:Tetratricopeptide repeat/Nucleoside 2-deoxyribosyltransferase
MASSSQRVFVLMPFAAEFDDVYMIIRDACAEESLGIDVLCLRADDIQVPGKITDQLMREIDQSDVIVADLTGSNGNVMYELGYAHALGKPTILLNQTADSPFDLRGHRQILYDRTRLVRDCRPRLITALRQVLGQHPAADVADIPKSSADEGLPIRLSRNLLAEFQTLQLRMQMANKADDEQNLAALGAEALALTDRITTDNGESDVLSDVAGTIGNCAVQLEIGELFQAAEDLYKRALSLYPGHPGVHRQYADYLLDRRNLAEAREHLAQAQQLDPDSERLASLELKLSVLEGNLDPEIANRIRTEFQKNRGSKRALVSYLNYLENVNAPIEEYEQVCLEWAEASSETDAVLQSRRLIADRLAELKDYGRAKSLYEEILPKLVGDDDDRHDVLHNLATIYANMDDRVAAKRCWIEAYNLKRNDPIVRAAFSQRLGQWDELPLALRVASGEPVDAVEEPETGGGGALASDEALAALRDKLSGGGS